MLEHYFIYMIECSNGSYYTGYTTDIQRRYQEHCNGSPKCKYTRSFSPLALRGCWVASDKSAALKAESFIKRLNKSTKIELLGCPKLLVDAFPELAVYPVSPNGVYDQ